MRQRIRRWTCLGVSNAQYFLDANDYHKAAEPASNGWVEITAIIDDFSSEIFVNGSLVLSGQRSGNNVESGLVLGACNNFGLGHFLNGSIGDVVIYNTVLGASDQQTVEQGLRAKYGF